MRHAGAISGLLAVPVLLAACSAEPILPPPSPALWEASGPDGERGWLFGTVHALPDGFEWRTPAIDKAFAEADRLAVEADLDSADPAWFARLTTTRGLGPPSRRVDPAYRSRLAAVFTDLGLSEDAFRDMESWAVALVLARSFRFGKSENGVDLALIKARGAKPLIELEGYKEQLAIFDALPVAEQIDMLEIVATEAKDAAARGRRQAEAWRTGDIATIEAEMETGLLADPELRETLLASRNRDWAGRIDRLLKQDGDLFVAVGAAHMLGEEGLVRLLEARGYRVRRIQ